MPRLVLFFSSTAPYHIDIVSLSQLDTDIEVATRRRIGREKERELASEQLSKTVRAVAHPLRSERNSTTALAAAHLNRHRRPSELI